MNIQLSREFVEKKQTDIFAVMLSSFFFSAADKFS